MKKFAATLGLFTLFSTLLFADIIVPRSVDDRLAGIGFINEKTTTIIAHNNEKVALSSRHVDLNNANSIFNSELARDESGTAHKRSIVLLSQNDIDLMNNRELRNAIYAAVGEKNKEISKSQWKLFRDTVKSKTQFKKTGFSNFYIVGNFVHHINASSQQSFFVAIIPKNIKVAKLLYQIEWFGNGLGGSNQLRMVFNQNFIAIPQMAAAYTPFIIQNQSGLADIVYSSEILRAQGSLKSPSISAGLTGEYANALQLYSVQSMAKRQVFKSVVKQYELTNLSEKQKIASFQAALSLSHGLQDTSIYNSVFNGSINHALLALRGLPTADGKGYLGATQIDPSWFNPYSVLNKISESGITTKFAGTLNNEFSYLKPPIGLTVMSDADLETTQGYKQLKKLRTQLLQTAGFDQFMKDVAIHLLQNNINHDKVQNIFKQAQTIFEEGNNPSRKLKGESKKLYKEIVGLWEKKSDAITREMSSEKSKSKQPELKDVFLALNSLQPQNI